MKRTVGWVLFFVMIPVIMFGMMGYLLADAFKYGWNWMEQTLEDWNE